ncbi:MAG: hypothetical protein SV377_01105, partial [Halobacteria archaeon]|nr:hypothetical protein [Halobacteria archaeon]
MSHLDKTGSEYETVRKKAGVRDTETEVLVLRGEDSLGFLNRIVTAELEGLKEGEGRRALLLTANGRVRADLRILMSVEELIVLMHETVVDELHDEWEENIFIEDVEVKKPGFSVITVQGPESRDVVSKATGYDDLPESLHTHAAIETKDGTLIRAVRSDSTGEGGYDLLVPGEELEGIHEDVLEGGAKPFGEHTHTVLRTEEGIPGFLNELKGRIPLDAGLYEVVSFDKGCYTGQEVVARVEQRGGGPNKALVGLKFDSSEGVEKGGDIEHNEEFVGEVTTVVESPVL